MQENGAIGHNPAWALNAVLEQRARPQRELVALLKQHPEWASVKQCTLHSSFAAALMASSLQEREIKGVLNVLPSVVHDDALVHALANGRWLSAEQVWQAGGRFSEGIDAQQVARWMLEPWCSWELSAGSGHEKEDDPLAVHRRAALEGLRATQEKDQTPAFEGDLLVHLAQTWIPRFLASGLDVSATLPVQFQLGDNRARDANAPFLALALTSNRVFRGRSQHVAWGRAWLAAAQSQSVNWETPSEWHSDSGVPLGEVVANILPQDAALLSEFEAVRWGDRLPPALPVARPRL